MKTTAYIAGPMTNRAHFNFPAFDAVAAHARELGIDVSNPHEHTHRQVGPSVLCLHEYVAHNGRTVRLYINHDMPRALTMSIVVGDDEEVMHSPAVDFDAIRDNAVIETLEHILALPDAEEPS